MSEFGFRARSPTESRARCGEWGRKARHERGAERRSPLTPRTSPLLSFRNDTPTPNMEDLALRRFLIVAAMLGAAVAPSTSLAQGTSTAERDAMAVVHKLFDAMRARDTATLRSVFTPVALLGSIETTNGVSALKRDAEGVEGFVKALARPSTVMWDERIAHPVVRVD